MAGYRSELVDSAIERLTGLGILDDAAFGRAWLESRDRAHPRGERALRHELLAKGLERILVDSLLAERSADAEGMPGEVDAAAAERLIARNARALARIPDARLRRQRAYALLARHGFDPEVASRVAAEAADALTPHVALSDQSNQR